MIIQLRYIDPLGDEYDKRICRIARLTGSTTRLNMFTTRRNKHGVVCFIVEGNRGADLKKFQRLSTLNSPTSCSFVINKMQRNYDRWSNRIYYPVNINNYQLSYNSFFVISIIPNSEPGRARYCRATSVQLTNTSSKFNLTSKSSQML